MKCAHQAAKKGLPFKFGSLTLPIDSYVYEVLVLGKDKKYWRIINDFMLAETDGQQWINECADIQFRSNSYQLRNCSKVTSEQWLEVSK
ncbi:MAG TPA: hypothetical protein ENJ41_01765 [Oceanospirillales bacterium]|nr:hypothetical protein [Oceanospirillales bacterium]